MRDKAPAMMREAMNQTNKPTTAATESLGTSYGWDQRCRNAEQAAHIGTYALVEDRNRPPILPDMR